MPMREYVIVLAKKCSDLGVPSWSDVTMMRHPGVMTKHKKLSSTNV